jgi:hypothetical protein
VHEIRKRPPFFQGSHVKYGINTPVAAYVSGMGISDREIACTIADYCYREVGLSLLPSVEIFRRLMQGLTFEDLLPVFRDRQLVQEVMAVLRRYKLDTRPVDYFADPLTIDFKTYVVGLRYENRLQILSQVSKGDELRLVREPDNIFDPYAMAVHTQADHKLGFIRSSKAFVLSTLFDEGWRFRCCVERIYPATHHPNRRLLVHIPPPLPF